MIQRRQTIFMFLSAIVSVLLFFVALASFSNDDFVMRFTIYGIENPIDSIELSKPSTWPMVIMAVLMTCIPVFTALKYKKRELQVKLCHLDMLLNVVFLGLVLLYFESDLLKVIESVEEDKIVLDSYYYGMSIPVVNLILQIFAVRGVKKDIELLKSVDRLR